MTSPPNAPIFARLESAFPDSVQRVWYKVEDDVGISDELWIMSTYDRNLSTYGLRGGGYAVIADNTFFASVAINLFFPLLAEQVAPGKFDVDHLLMGNAKLYLSEAYLYAGKTEAGRQMLLEYLVDHETDNLELLEAIRSFDFDHPIEQLVGQAAKHMVLMHEVGHFYGPNDIPEGRLAVSEQMRRDGHDIDSFSARRLHEELLCDLFGSINALGVLMNAGIAASAARDMVNWFRLSIHAIQSMRETIISDEEYEGAKDLSGSEMMFRHTTVHAILEREDLAQHQIPEDAKNPPVFEFDQTRLLNALLKANGGEAVSRRGRRLATLFREALNAHDPFEHLYKNSIRFARTDGTPI
ncbi:hypothetical protein [Ruegeria sp.]|uniref:hypothetical protein n=1 Tax=Ruegeria sp. TaxID=1879320 RepID=UPI0023084D0F|nr:hypothetical protein [Ruegeria sp.]MDA7967160.1 hypothetical protein [Ruegeria sp.]